MNSDSSKSSPGVLSGVPAVQNGPGTSSVANVTAPWSLTEGYTVSLLGLCLSDLSMERRMQRHLAFPNDCWTGGRLAVLMGMATELDTESLCSSRGMILTLQCNGNLSSTSFSISLQQSGQDCISCCQSTQYYIQHIFRLRGKCQMSCKSYCHALG